MAEWTIATVCKTVALTGYPGSNPGPDTKFIYKFAASNAASPR